MLNYPRFYDGFLPIFGFDRPVEIRRTAADRRRIGKFAGSWAVDVEAEPSPARVGTSNQTMRVRYDMHAFARGQLWGRSGFVRRGSYVCVGCK